MSTSSNGAGEPEESVQACETSTGNVKEEGLPDVRDSMESAQVCETSIENTKEASSSNVMDTTDKRDHDSPRFAMKGLPLQDLLKLHCRQTLRFSASDIAAMTGFHPFKILPHLLIKLVYQGTTGYWLQKRDAQALGLGLAATEEEIWKSLAEQAGPKTQKALQKAMTQQTKTVQEAQKVKQQVVKHAKESGKLKPEEIKVLQDGCRHVVNTRFGNFHEENALDLCEKQFGWDIFDRNCEIMEWAFRKVSTDTVEPISPAKPCWSRQMLSTKSHQREGETGRKRQKLEPETVDLTEEDDDKKDQKVQTTTMHDSMEKDVDLVPPAANGSEISVDLDDVTNTTNATQNDCQISAADGALQPCIPTEKDPGTNQSTAAGAIDSKPFFVIRGSVDGRRDELVPVPFSNEVNDATKRDEFDDDWNMQPVIVELKHRMNRLFHFPPLYEQIQAVAYCLMYDVNDADIVQVMRHEGEQSESKGAKAKQRAKANSGKTGGKSCPDDGKTMESIIPFLTKKKPCNDGNENMDPNATDEQAGNETAAGATDTLSEKINPSTRENSLCDDEANDARDAKLEGKVETKTTEVIDSVSITVSNTATRECMDNGEIISDCVKITTISNSQNIEGMDSSVEEHMSSTKSNAGSEVAAGPTKAGSTLDVTTDAQSNCIARETTDCGEEKDAATLVDVVTTNAKATCIAEETHKAKTSENADSAVPTKARPKKRLSIQAHRITLADDRFQHGRNWHEVVLPRLRSFADMIYNIQKDDSKRYRLLLACSDPLGQREKEAWDLIHEECPWLRSCDTAYNRYSNNN